MPTCLTASMTPCRRRRSAGWRCSSPAASVARAVIPVSTFPATGATVRGRRARPASPMTVWGSDACAYPRCAISPLTAPYMHDGRFATLDAVLDHYQRVGKTSLSAQGGQRDPRLRTFTLDQTEREALDRIPRAASPSDPRACRSARRAAAIRLGSLPWNATPPSIAAPSPWSRWRCWATCCCGWPRPWPGPSPRRRCWRSCCFRCRCGCRAP